MKTARKSFEESYACKQAWDENISVQCGDVGVVLVKDGQNYKTAFFEAFPRDLSCFVRGEGKDVEEAELNAWEKYQKIKACSHEMERRNRKDGYGYCKHCSYSSMVFEPITKCCKCNKPTNYTVDYKGKSYCKKHSINKPLNPNPSPFERFIGGTKEERLPRKLKKVLKKAAIWRFRSEGFKGEVIYIHSFWPKFKCGDFVIDLLFKSSIKRLIQNYKKHN